MIDTRCAGCGTSFKGERGLRAHQGGRFVAMGCRPVTPSPSAFEQAQHAAWSESMAQTNPTADTSYAAYREAMTS